jgi:hypothetical protein
MSLEVGNIYDSCRIKRCIQKLLDQYEYDIANHSPSSPKKHIEYRVLINGFVSLHLISALALRKPPKIFVEWIRMSDQCRLFASVPQHFHANMADSLSEKFSTHIKQYTDIPIKKCKSCLELCLPDDEYCIYCSIQVSVYHEICSICLDEYRTRAKWVMTPCSHIFHRECVESALRVKESCPLCREQCTIQMLKIY